MIENQTARHLRLLMQQANDTQPVESYALMTTEIPTYLGAPLLPPVERTRYVRPRRFDSFRTWVDTSPAVDAAFWLTSLTALLGSLAALGSM